MIPNIYNANYQILQTEDHVVIVMEMIHEARVIPLDRPHASGGIRQWLGDSRGRWEGDTLVVETVHFNDRLDGGDYQPSHIIQTGHRGPGGTLRLVERFRMVDANAIDYQFTVEDPETFTRPYTVSIPMTRRDTTDPLNHLFEYACHEGNHGMMNLLRGRAHRRAAGVDGGGAGLGATQGSRAPGRARAGRAVRVSEVAPLGETLDAQVPRSGRRVHCRPACGGYAASDGQ